MRRVVLLSIVVLAAVLVLSYLAQAPEPAPTAEQPTPHEGAPDDPTTPTAAKPRRARIDRPTDAADDELAAGSKLVRVTDDAGRPLEGIRLAVFARGDLRTGPGCVTDSSGIARLDAVVPEDVSSVRVALQQAPDGEPGDPHAVAFTSNADDPPTIVLPRSLVPVMVVRLHTRGPRECVARFGRVEDPVEDGLAIPPAQDAFRVPLPPPRVEEMQFRVVCPGFEEQTVEVRPPSETTEFAVNVHLRPGGAPTHGLVLGEDGLPAEGVRVAGYLEQRVGRLVMGEVHTDAQGRFPLHPDVIGHWLHARRDGESCSDWVRVDETTDALVLRLGAGGVVRGIVRDEDGLPIADLEVRVWVATPHVTTRYRTASRRAGMVPARGFGATTNEAGAYEIRGLPLGWGYFFAADWTPGDGTRTVGEAEYDAVAADWEREVLDRGGWIPRSMGDTLTLDLSAERPTPPIEPAVTEAEPVAAVVRLAPTFGGVVADAWRIERVSVPSLYEIAIGEDGVSCELPVGRHSGLSAIVRVTRPAPGWCLLRTGEFDVVQGATIELACDVVPVPTVEAQLVDLARALVSIAGLPVEVTAYDLGGLDGGPAITDERGRADITPLIPWPGIVDREPEGRLWIDLAYGAGRDADLVRVTHLPVATVAEWLAGRDAEPRVVKLVCNGPHAQWIEVLDADSGLPVADQSLVLEWREGRAPPSRLNPERTVRTDRDGRAKFHAFVPERAGAPVHPPRIRAEGGHTIEWDRDSFERDPTRPWRARMTRCGIHRLRLIDERGKPISGARVTAPETATTDAAGHVDLDAPDRGTVLRVRGYVPVELPLRRDERIDVEPTPTRGCAVLVRSPESGAGERVVIDVWDVSGSLVSTTALPTRIDGLAAGRVGLPPGPCELHARLGDQERWGRFSHPYWTAQAFVDEDTSRVELELAKHAKHRVTLEIPGGSAATEAIDIELRYAGDWSVAGRSRPADTVPLDLPVGRTVISVTMTDADGEKRWFESAPILVRPNGAETDRVRLVER